MYTFEPLAKRSTNVEKSWKFIPKPEGEVCDCFKIKRGLCWLLYYKPKTIISGGLSCIRGRNPSWFWLHPVDWRPRAASPVVKTVKIFEQFGYCTSSYFCVFSVSFPDEPTNLTVTSITSRSVEISWVNPKNRVNYGLSRFLIKLKKDNSLIFSVTTGMVNHYSIHDLSPYVTYEISVTGGNSQGFENAATTFILTSEEGII